MGRGTWFARVCAFVLALFLSIGWPTQSAAYAVLSHEAIIDSAWDTNIRPLVLKRFPDATAEELKEAHGYAYGGVIIRRVSTTLRHMLMGFSEFFHVSWTGLLIHASVGTAGGLGALRTKRSG